MNELKIEYVSIEQLVPYANNAKLHPAEQIEQIKKSIQEFGFNDPIAIWKDNEVIEGHGRLIAAKELGLDVVPIIRLDGLTDEQRKAYMIAHNKLTMNTAFDIDVLSEEIKILMDEFDFTDFGFGEFELAILTEDFNPEQFDPDEIKGYSGAGENELQKQRVIITYSAEDEERVKKMLGISEIKKVVYDMKELDV